MRVGTILLAVSLLAVTWAGCIGEDNDGTGVPGSPEDQEDPGQAEVLGWGLERCSTVVAVIPVDEAGLAEHLPDGFEPVSAEAAFGLPPDPRGDGAIGLETFDCQAGQGLEGSLEQLAYGAVFAPVEVTENRSHPDAELTFYKWSTLVPDDPRRQVLQAKGLPAVDGSTDLSGLQEAPAGHTFDVSLTLGEAAFGFSGTATAPNEDFREGLPFVEFQAGDDGYALWASLENQAQGANSGTGTVTLDEDHWTSELVGRSSEQAYMVASTNVTFEQASIALP